jgi:hypothetical protein
MDPGSVMAQILQARRNGYCRWIDGDADCQVSLPALAASMIHDWLLR